MSWQKVGAKPASTQRMLKARLLKDIDELQRQPYPGIQLHIDDSNLTRACLVLAPEGEETPLHLTLYFGERYPLDPPNITIQSNVSHPNVFDEHICINILVTEDGYTPAYTLKGICIQMLSFFFSDTIDQMYGENGGRVDRKKWQGKGTNGYGEVVEKDHYKCRRCKFGSNATSPEDHSNTTSSGDHSAAQHPREAAGHREPIPTADPDILITEAHGSTTSSGEPDRVPTQLVDLPNELLLVICENLDDEGLLLAARAWNGFGRVMRQFNIIRTRELQCFTLKQGFKDLELGIGVHVQGKSIQSEFDILSRTAFEDLEVRQSIQGLRFEHWLPLPMSRKHWSRARSDIDQRLNRISGAANLNLSSHEAIYSFMNEVIVRLSTEAEELEARERRSYARYEAPKSTLTAASEKAIESYFHLFHLLLCLACERPAIPNEANNTIKNFIAGNRDKYKVPNLGYLLIEILISEVDVTPELTKAIIEEAITRNVVWMLDKRGSDMAELSFVETSDISWYRLGKTFEAGKTSYRLLMFLNLMRKVVRSTRNELQEEGTQQKLGLADLRDRLFSRHGAPPNGAAAQLAEQVKKISQVNDFPNFCAYMDVRAPTASSFTALLRSCVQKSHDRGYSKAALTQEQALGLRLEREGPKVERPVGMQPAEIRGSGYTFFPNQQRGGGRGGRGGRGRGRGR